MESPKNGSFFKVNKVKLGLLNLTSIFSENCGSTKATNMAYESSDTGGFKFLGGQGYINHAS